MFEDRYRSLLAAPSPAVLTVYRSNGEAVVSPVWFRLNGEWLEVVVAAGDSKLDYLRANPRGVILVFETVRPFRGFRITADATISADEDAATRREIASRYLGVVAAARYADLGARPPGFVVRFPLSAAKAWDLEASLPD